MKSSFFLYNNAWATRFFSYFTVLCLCFVISCSLAACRAWQDTSDTAAGNWQDGSRQFACEFRAAPDNFTGNNIRPQLSGNLLFYIARGEENAAGWKLCQWNIADDTVQEIPVALSDNFNLIAFHIDEEGNQYFHIVDLTEMSGDVYTRLLIKLDAQGKEVYRRNITGDLESAKPVMIRELLVDGGKRVYLSDGREIWMFDEYGRFHGIFKPESVRIGIGCSKDGKVYTGELGMPGEGVKWQELDFSSCKVVKNYRNFLGTVSNLIVPQGNTGDFLPFDTVGISEYDMRSETLKNIVKWENCNILGNQVQDLAVLEDGSFLVLLMKGGDREIAVLTETNRPNTEKKEIVLGTLYTYPRIQEAVVNYNRYREDCRIVIREYGKISGEMSRENAVTAVNNDIAAGRGPDLLVLNQGLPLEDYAAKGVIEDLTPYLENSSKLKKEGFVESVLNMYTFEGILAGIPSAFGLQTLVGKASIVGEKMGCRVETLMSLADQYPEASLMQNGTNLQVLGACILCCQEDFVNWRMGECYFDTLPFIQILEFAGRFPDNIQRAGDLDVLAGQLQNEEILLMAADIYNTFQYKRILEMFGKEAASCIGYPTVDGSAGCIAYPFNEVYGIAAGSEHRQEAWSFIEAYLAGELTGGESSAGLPSYKKELEALIAKAIKGEYRGYPDSAPLTEKEARQLMELVEAAEPEGISDDVISSIILEEAQSCFGGRITVREASERIQNRVMIYLQEQK